MQDFARDQFRRVRSRLISLGKHRREKRAMTRAGVQRLFVLSGAIMVAAIIAATFVTLDMQRREAIDGFRIATANLGGGMAQQTRQSFVSAIRILDSIRDNLTSAPNASGAAIQAAMRSKSMSILLDQRRELSAFQSLFLVDPEGWVASASGPREMSTNASGRHFFRHFKAVDDHLIFIGMPVQDPATHTWALYMAQRVDDTRGALAGIVVGKLALADFEKFYQLAMPPKRTVYLARSDGVVLVRFPSRPEEIGSAIPQKSPWRGVGAKGGVYLGHSYFDNTPILASVHPLRNLPLVVETSVSQADTLANWNRQKPWVLAGGAGASLCVVLVLFLFWSQYQRVEMSEVSLAAKNAELDLSHAQLTETLANLSHGVCLYDGGKRLLLHNKRYCEIYDLRPEAVVAGMSLTDIGDLYVKAGSLGNSSLGDHVGAIEDGMSVGAPFDTVDELPNGKIVSVHFRPLPAERWVSTHEDITERRKHEMVTSYQALHDPLTGLANRVAFFAAIEKVLADAKRGTHFALLCLDLDRFKWVNDTHGHPAGDMLLCAVADRLRAEVRPSDLVARLGGDEFAILLQHAEQVRPELVAPRIVNTIGKPFDLNGIEANIGVSIGIAMPRAGVSNPTQLMKDADFALYRSKLEGRGTWRFYESAMDEVVQKRSALESDLRQALQLDQLELYYQPLVGGKDRRITGFEALLRWHHPTHGLVPPSEFIPIAEEIGLIGEIGAWVLQRACMEAARWPDDIRVAVNFSSRQFRDPNIGAIVAKAIQDSGISARRLELEITETVALATEASTLTLLHSLRALGVRVALDDFGTGYSSLSYLRSFPFNSIKIDGSFVGDLWVRDEAAEIIRGIIGLATNLRMDVTAEGVETEEQFQFLADAGCKDIQGYFMSKAVPASEIPALMLRLSGAQAGRRSEAPTARLKLLSASGGSGASGG
jgi:diguanylate cyclase (GGDEF)-like protein